ncbi:hypothetical protein CH63R_11244 [Colletotrichum higginsianum IMI 349063]|uniref:Uncharacterized protein n=1 Tax=Colletotrichum higginsianum (strain IMI 349063) TaxID=759273 RepID=A0A1B7XXS7_COLHI|nr:hypothetical protein CH63R_11244 [Colletotrichum higginsianum IMI 349063]OBR04541.1 hypothetical protein CH63R_11244 [Colletotrichum higginsianum IMI 349063]
MCRRDPAGLDVRHAALNTAVGQEHPGIMVELIAELDSDWQELLSLWAVEEERLLFDRYLL